MIVFPKSLWNYDTAVDTVKLIDIAKPLLPPEFELKLDLFHPDFKHSPKMFSPEFHSPFPPVGISIADAEKEESPPSVDGKIDVDEMRAKLDALFQSSDAAFESLNSAHNPKISKNLQEEAVLRKCRAWLQVGRQKTEPVEESAVEWAVQTHGVSPFHLYRTLWNSILALYSVKNKTNVSSSVAIDPFLDSRTLRRIATTVNASLKKLDVPVRITEVVHPGSGNNYGDDVDNKRRSTHTPPYGMIKLSRH